MDADGSHQPEQLPRLLEALGHADVVLGSRWVPGGRVENWPAHRMFLSRGGNTYTRIVLGLPLRDATGGFRAFRRSALESLDLAGVASQGYCFQVDLAWRAVQRGLRVVEVPITFVERVRGNSKMSGSIVRESLTRVTAWGIRHRAEQLRGPGRPRPALGRGAPMSPARRLRARQVLGLVLLGFLLIIAAEIVVAVLVARLIGPWPTMIAILAFSFGGLMVVRRAGARSVQALRAAGAARRLPGGEMADHALLLVGGILLIPPGFLLDLVGLVFILPVTRPLARRLCGLVLRARFFSRMAAGLAVGRDAGRSGRGVARRRGRRPGPAGTRPAALATEPDTATPAPSGRGCGRRGVVLAG